MKQTIEIKKRNFLFLLFLVAILPIILWSVFTAVLFQSRAANFVSLESELGILSGNVIAANDTTASGGRYILFGIPIQTSPPSPIVTASPSPNPTASTRPTVMPSPSGSPNSLTYDQLKILIDTYKATHSGNGGKDWDILGCCSGASRTPAQIAADPQAQVLRSICGPDQLPIIPNIAWEYGGADHPWINPQVSALVYCVYIPVHSSTTHWQYNPTTNHVIADAYVKFPDQNPCKNQLGANLVLSCLGDSTNSEIFVDTASFHDGNDVGFDLSVSTSQINLLLPDGSKVLFINNI